MGVSDPEKLSERIDMVFRRARVSRLGMDRRAEYSSSAEMKMEVSVSDLSRSESNGGQGCRFLRKRVEIAGTIEKNSETIILVEGNWLGD
jgi:hypothetical protein